jgi:hypothetical protein
MNPYSLADHKIQTLEDQITKLECDHQHTKIRYREASNSARLYRAQCCRCGEMVGNWIPHGKVEQKDGIEPIDDELPMRYRQSKRELELALKQRVRDHEKSDWDEWYAVYLASPEWREKRAMVLKRCAGVCEGCGKKRAQEVHHLTYKNVGKEFLFELVGLCRECHAIISPAEQKEATNA